MYTLVIFGGQTAYNSQFCRLPNTFRNTFVIYSTNLLNGDDSGAGEGKGSGEKGKTEA